MTPDTTTQRTGSSRLGGTATALIVVSAYAVVAAGVLWWAEGLPAVVRLPLALPLVLVAPGYAVVTALFPASGGAARTGAGESAPERGGYGGLSSLERGILAVAASVAIVPMVALAAAGVVGVVAGPILAGVAGVTVVASAIAVVRGPREQAIAVRQPDGSGGADRSRLGAIRDSVVTDRVTQLSIVLTALLLVVSGAVAFTGAPDDAGATEFYLVDQAGTPGDGSGEASSDTGDAATAVFDLRIAHHGPTAQQYTTVVLLDRGDGQSPTELRRSSTEVGPDETAAVTHRVPESELAENTTVRFLLYRGEAPSTADPDAAHRTLQLSIDATAE